MKMKKIMHAGIIMMLIYSCTPVSKMYISDINSLDEAAENSILYSLPKTVVKVTARAVKSEFVPGPYAAYADKYLGIEGVGQQPLVTWSLSEIEIDTYIETDPDFYYTVAIENDKGVFNNTINSLSSAGLIITPYNLPKKEPVAKEITVSDKKILYTDLSVKKNLIEEKETSYKRVLQDSGYVQVPVENVKYTEKTLEQKAEEAANFIIKLRKRKLKMLTGQSETSVDSGAGAATEELRRIEEEYISLFTGKTLKSEESKTFEYVPLTNKETEQVVLFKLSETDGMIGPFEQGGKPVILEITKSNTTKILEKLAIQDKVSKIENTLFYRMPEDVKITIKESDKTLLEGKASIFQQGALISMKVQ